MGQLIQAEITVCIGFVGNIGITRQRDHRHMMRLGVDHEQQVDVAAQLLVWRAHLIDAADVDDEAVFGHVLVTGIFPGAGV